MRVRGPMNEWAAASPTRFRGKFSPGYGYAGYSYSTTRVQRPAPDAICMQISWESQHMQKQHTPTTNTRKKIKKQAKKKRGQKQLNKTRHQNQKRATVRRARQLDTHHPLFYRTGTISKVTWTTSDWIEIYRKGGYAVLVNLVVKKVLIFGYQYNFLNNFLLRFYNFAMNYHYLTAINENNPIIIRG